MSILLNLDLLDRAVQYTDVRGVFVHLTSEERVFPIRVQERSFHSKISMPAILLLFAVTLFASAEAQLSQGTMVRLTDNWTICDTQRLAEQYLSYKSDRAEQAMNAISDQGLGVFVAKGTRVKIVDSVPGYSRVQIVDGPDAGYVGWIFSEVLERS